MPNTIETDIQKLFKEIFNIDLLFKSLNLTAEDKLFLEQLEKENSLSKLKTSKSDEILPF